MPLFGGNLSLNYDGLSSRKFNLTSVKIGNGMYEDTFTSSRTLNTIKTKGQNKSILQSIEEDVISFPVTLAFNKNFTTKDLEEVVLWLFQNEYKPFYFEDEPDKIAYCIASGDSNIIHNGLMQGYITITMESDSSRFYSNTKITNVLEVRNNLSKNLAIRNAGHDKIFPEISLLKIGDGNIKIKDTLKGNIFEIKNLKDGEDIYLDCDREIIESDATGVYHYDDMSGDMPSLEIGSNNWNIVGNCDLIIRYQEAFKF